MLRRPCHGGDACACEWDHPQKLIRNVARRPARLPILPRQKPRDRSLPVPPSCPCRADGESRPCACLSTPPRCSAVRRDWGLSLMLSTAPRKAPRSTHAAGVIIRFVGQSISAPAPTAKRFFERSSPRAPAAASRLRPKTGERAPSLPITTSIRPFSAICIFFRIGLCNAEAFVYKPAHRSLRRYPGGE